jgi:small subunit ribosomal protein S4e
MFMAKRGGTKHLKRIAAPPAIPIHDKKANTWVVKVSPGGHKKTKSIPLLVLIRDILKFAYDAREAKKIIARRIVKVDGKVRTDPKFPVGLMDVISFDGINNAYRIGVDLKGRLTPILIPKDEETRKIAKVVSKHPYKNKIVLHFHDGKNIISSDAVKIGDSAIIKLPENKIEGILKLEKGARCLITEGTHAGTIATLEEIIEQKGTRRKEAKLSTPSGEFITVADYLLVVDDKFKGVDNEHHA